MNKLLVSLFIFSMSSFLSGNEPLPEVTDNLLLNRLQMQQTVRANVENEQQDFQTTNKGKKSVGRAVLFSAILPGSGQLYAKSYIKAATFLAVEAIAWSVNITYNNQGDEKDAEFKVYAEDNWSEQRYWSYVYHRLNGRTEAYPEFPHGQFDGDIQLDNAGRPIIQNWEAAEQTLDPFASTEYLSGFSHTLPDTRTQQYYEMIGKYPLQFGNAWADASFEATYQDFGQGNITEQNEIYAVMRDDANKLYDRAAYGSMIALLNHLFSAIDAGFTTRRYNNRVLSLSYQQKWYNEQYVDMFGVTMSF